MGSMGRSTPVRRNQGDRYYYTVIQYRPPSTTKIVIQGFYDIFMALVDLGLVVTGTVLVVGFFIWMGME